MSLLDKTFFERDAIKVAFDLIGKFLYCKQESGEIRKCRIVETEAYMTEDPFCYGVRYGKTINTLTSFCNGGFVFVYASMLMVTTGRNCGDPQNVLIRAGEENGCHGPIKLSNWLGISKDFHNGVSLSEENGVWVCDDSDLGAINISESARGEFNKENAKKDYVKKNNGKVSEAEAEEIICKFMKEKWRFKVISKFSQ